MLILGGWSLATFWVGSYSSPFLKPEWMTPLLILLVAVFRLLSTPLSPGSKILVAFGEPYVLAIMLWHEPLPALLIVAAGESLGHVLSSLRYRYLDMPRREIFPRDEVLLTFFIAGEALLVWSVVAWVYQLLDMQMVQLDGLLWEDLWRMIRLVFSLTIASAAVKVLFQLMRRARLRGILSVSGIGRGILIRILWIPLCVILAEQLAKEGRLGEFGWLTTTVLIVNLLVYRSYHHGAALAEKVRMLELLQHGASTVHESSRLELLLHSFSDDACRVVPSLSLSVAFLCKDDDRVHYVFVHHDDHETMLEPGRYGSSWIRKVVERDRPFIVRDTEVDPTPLDGDPLLAKCSRAPRSVVAVPLRVQHKTIGAVTFWSTRRFAFSAEIERTLVSLADFVGTAIGKLRLIDELRKAEQRYRSLFEYAGDGIFLLDAQGGIIDENPRATRILGLEPARLEGRSFESLFPIGEREQVRALLRGAAGTPLIREGYHFQLESGETIDLGMSIATLVLDGAQRFLVHVRDRSEAARLQRQLFRSQRMEVVGNLASGIAHDINNLLGVILAHSMLIHERVGPMLSESDSLKTIRKSAMEGAAMARRLLHYARGAEPDRAPLMVGDLLRSSVELLKNSLPGHVHLKLELCVDDVVLLVDKSQIQQVLLNMAINACDAMPGEGEFVIRASLHAREPSAEAREKSGCDGEYIVISLADTGFGIPPEIRKHIFEPFYTTKGPEHGTGLGLFVCRAIIQAHHGEIEVESEVGKGTTFHLLLPIPSATLMPQLRQMRAGGDSKKLILFEADPSVGDRLEVILRDQGYDLKRVHTLDAIAAEDPGVRARPILVDLHFGGVEQAREMAEMFPDENFIWIVDDPGLNEILPGGLPIGREWLEDQIEVQVLLRALRIRHTVV